jgi:two-component system sensor histidine kinase/response regulator
MKIQVKEIAMTHILVVEDNPTLLENITFELEMLNYQVTQATDGRQALNRLQSLSTKPDLIVSDIAMPEMDGYEFLEAVRKNDQWNVIPFIFLTAFDSINAIRLGKQLGVDDYLVKPFEPEDLILAIENKLKRHREINNQAERDLDSKRRELINMIAHELRTPMTSIYGGIELLEYNLKNVSDDTTLQMLELVNSGTKRLHRLINRVVTMVQIESGHLRRMLESPVNPLDMNELILKVLAEFDLPTRNVTVNVKLGPNNPPVRGVREYLKVALYELIDNAIKFSHPGAAVTIETIYEGKQAQVIIQDEGVGIPAHEINRIWNHFTQVNRQTQEQQGIGLGLAIVQEIVTAHDGQCHIASKEKQGTKVVFTLPY